MTKHLQIVWDVLLCVCSYFLHYICVNCVMGLFDCRNLMLILWEGSMTKILLQYVGTAPLAWISRRSTAKATENLVRKALFWNFCLSAPNKLHFFFLSLIFLWIFKCYGTHRSCIYSTMKINEVSNAIKINHLRMFSISTEIVYKLGFINS